MSADRVVVAAVIERGGYVLVSQRPQGSGYAGYWEFPGGKREQGESDVDALVRELREELDIEVIVGERIWQVSAPPLDLRFYRCSWRAGESPRALLVSQFRWVRTADMDQLAFPPADGELVARLAAGTLL